MNIEPRDLLRDPVLLLGLGFGSGLGPKAPGTWGSVVAACLFPLIALTGPIITLAFVVISIPLGIWICGHSAKRLGLKDPGPVVFDEFVGQWIALLFLPSGWYWLIVGFVLFRIFDILKPWPVSWLDRNLEGGAGIMLDDVAAGIYALILLQAIAWAVGQWL